MTKNEWHEGVYDMSEEDYFQVNNLLLLLDAGYTWSELLQELPKGLEGIEKRLTEEWMNTLLEEHILNIEGYENTKLHGNSEDKSET